MLPIIFFGSAAGQTVLTHFGQSNSFDGLAPRGEGDHAAFLFPVHRSEVRLLQDIEQLLSGLFGSNLQTIMGGDRFILPEDGLHFSFRCLQSIPDMPGRGQKQFAFLT